jgi:DNA-binding HxlR family transcriptional regulator
MSRQRRSGCPIASALDLLGDRWTLVLIRDFLTGKRAYSELLASPERIPTNILADRLRRLETWGVIERRATRDRPGRPRYALTKKGADLLPVLQQLCRWGNRYVEGSWRPPAYFMQERPVEALRRLARKEAGRAHAARPTPR